MVAVAFIHPDLGIGGAERLVCDAALALQRSGHTVQIYTSHHDPSHCFAETKDGTLTVHAVGDWLPRQFLWKCYAFFAYIRMIYVAFYLLLFSGYDADVIFCDQISACIPVLKLCKKVKVIFYCHFPDMLLTQRKSALKTLYRAPLDWLEEKTTGLADIVLVNSQFTAHTFFTAFKTLHHVEPVILYPSLNFDAFNKVSSMRLDGILPANKEFIFLSINRYERKKNLPLVINAFNKLREVCSEDVWEKVHLVIAGGYDDRVEENTTHYLELGRLATDLHLMDNITFLCSFSDDQKIALLKHATCLIYTPSNEHFGIVPIEAMYMRLPVIACNSGGPLETIEHEVTGYLCESNATAFAGAMKTFIDIPSLKSVFGDAGHQRVNNHFSFESFRRKLDQTVIGVVASPSEGCCSSRWKLIVITSIVVLMVAYILPMFLL